MCLQTENLSVHDMEYDGRGYESERNSSVEIPGASNAFPERPINASLPDITGFVVLFGSQRRMAEILK